MNSFDDLFRAMGMADDDGAGDGEPCANCEYINSIWDTVIGERLDDPNHAVHVLEESESSREDLGRMTYKVLTELAPEAVFAPSNNVAQRTTALMQLAWAMGYEECRTRERASAFLDPKGAK